MGKDTEEYPGTVTWLQESVLNLEVGCMLEAYKYNGTVSRNIGAYEFGKWWLRQIPRAYSKKFSYFILQNFLGRVQHG